MNEKFNLLILVTSKSSQLLNFYPWITKVRPRGCSNKSFGSSASLLLCARHRKCVSIKTLPAFPPSPTMLSTLLETNFIIPARFNFRLDQSTILSSGKALINTDLIDYFRLFIVATGCPSERRSQKTVSCYWG